MKSLKPYLTAVAAMFLFAVLIYSTTVDDTRGQIMQENRAYPDPVWPRTGQNLIALDTVSTQASTPFLKIDGKGSRDIFLQSLDISVEVTGNIASTRYTMVFKNRTDRILEGELTFPLPDGVTATHYALDIDGRMREAVPVDKARATQVFGEIQRREVYPGIRERVEGNNFRTRIYPFPRRGTRTISIGYEEELTLVNDSLYYRLPMDYPNLERFALKATVWNSSQMPVVSEGENEFRFGKVGENHVAMFTRQNFIPSRSLNFALPAPADIPQVMMQPAQGSFYFLASVAPEMEVRKKRWSDDLAIIWDVSLSGLQRNLKREMEMLDIIFAEKKNANIHLYFLNNKLKKAGEYKVAGGKWDELKSVLRTAVFDGGTAFSQINLNEIAGKEVLFFSDGISTLSNADFLSNIDVNQSIRPIHTIVSSPKADYSAMKLISIGTKGKFVNLNALSTEKLKDELLNETLQFLGTEHGGALSEVYPSIATSVYGNFSIAGISNANNAEMTLLFGFGDKVEKRIPVKLDAQKAVSRGNIHKIWAQKKIAELDLEYEKNRDVLTALGQQFGIVTRNTSLMVLELLSDYVRFGIEPPDNEPALQDEYWIRLARREDKRRRDTRDTEDDMLKAAISAAQKIKKWHKTDFTPKQPSERPARENRFPMPDNQSVIKRDFGDRLARKNFDDGQQISAVPPLSLLGIFGFLTGCSGAKLASASSSESSGSGAARSSMRSFAFESAEVMGYLDSPYLDSPRQRSETEPDMTPSKPAKPAISDNEYLSKRTEYVVSSYQTYLLLREDYVNLPTFYFDMADRFFKLDDRETAIRVLTSIAELELEDASLYRLLGYRFKEYGEYELQKFVTQKVLEWRPMDPQSYRDYALALADNGEPQAALDSLYSILTRPFSADIIRRSNGIEEVIVTEINHLIAKHPKLNTSKINRRLLIKIPVDIRVVINWNVNNSDVDLYVRDPNREVCSHYIRKQMAAGGRLSANNKAGYGPEQFMLRKAVNGKYRFHVDYYGSREFAAPGGPVTVMAEIYTRYADQTEERRVTTMQLTRRHQSRNGVRVLMGEVDFTQTPPR
jgi:hypothetical protein